MARVTPQQYAEKWARRSKQATQDMRNGVEQVTVAPGEAAAQAADRLIANFVEAVQSGKWAENVRAVPLDSWKKSMIEKGIPRVAQGVDSAQDSQVQMAEQLLGHVDRIKGEVARMPKGTIEDSVARMNHFSREMNKIRIRKSR